jgi:hypothetical protein
MSKDIKISNDLYNIAKKACDKEVRSISLQIEGWARLWLKFAKIRDNLIFKKLYYIETTMLEKYGFSKEQIEKMLKPLKE